MNREILFRGQRSDNKEWVYGYLAYPDTINVIVKDDIVGFQSIDDYEVDPETVGQYIGQKDKYNIDAYEADVIEIYWPDGVVTRETISFSEKYGYFMYGNNPICELQDPLVPFKVVGNIYEQ